MILADFIQNFCFTPKDRQVSRGYLAGLPALLDRVDRQSDAFKAALIAALAIAGKQQKREDLLKRAERLYISLLGSFRQAIASLRQSTCVATFVTSVLLGLYEVSVPFGPFRTLLLTPRNDHNSDKRFSWRT